MRPHKPHTIKSQVGMMGIVLGVIGFVIAGAIFAEGRLATSRVWLMMALFWSTWGIADILPPRFKATGRILRIATFLCGAIGFWFAVQL
jgi:hypothetical protein